MTPTQQIESRVKYFEALHKAFFDWFIAELRRDSSAFTRYRLQLASVFFDDIDLQKVVQPLFANGVSNPDEKRAVARAALYDALVAHTFGTHLASSDALIHDRLNKIEELATGEVKASAAKVKALEEKVESYAKSVRENLSRVPKGKQTSKGAEAGQQE